MIKFISPKTNCSGVFFVPGDKSISHRAVMFGSIAKGDTVIHGFLKGEDCLSTISCFKKMGISIDTEGDTVTVHGKGLYGLQKPDGILDVGNSGTTLRLLTGLLSAQNFSCEMTGDSSIQKRPMDRVIYPLSKMGAVIKGTEKNGKLCAPLSLTGSPLKAITYALPVASAQVKSALILAGLYAEGETVLIEKEPTRDHTEIMLRFFGASIKTEGKKVSLLPPEQLYGQEITVPGDISSAAYLLAAGLLCPLSQITVKNVGINPTRTGLLDVLKRMGANLKIDNYTNAWGEPTADITAFSSSLKATEIGGEEIPRLIDEIPILAVLATQASGTTIIRNAEELKVKESNRIDTVVSELTKIGADIEKTEDGMIIHGKTHLLGGEAESHQDHRIAMSLAIAGLCSKEGVKLKDAQCVDISFPSFYDSIDMGS